MAIIKPAKSAKDQLESSSNTTRSMDELVIRDAVEKWGRDRWPDARQVHELVVGRGQCRADMAFVCQDNIVGVEIKSGWDNTSRLMMQAAHFSLACPEVWIVIDPKHGGDTAMVRYLMPWLGEIHVDVTFPEKYEERKNIENWTCGLQVVHEAKQREPMPNCFLEMCWRDELYVEAQRYNLQPPSRITHQKLIELLMEKLTDKQRIEAVCRRLRARDAFWRSDDRIEA